VLRLLAAKLDLVAATFALTRTVLNILEMDLIGPHVCERVAYLGMSVRISSVRLNSPPIAASQETHG
jgi:hypothetical protein